MKLYVIVLANIGYVKFRGSMMGLSETNVPGSYPLMHDQKILGSSNVVKEKTQQFKGNSKKQIYVPCLSMVVCYKCKSMLFKMSG